jgi:HEPN domain-containing protein
MPNRSYALEWLEMARRNLETAQLLFDVNHYTDVIAVDIQQTIEKTFKALN